MKSINFAKEKQIDPEKTVLLFFESAESDRLFNGDRFVRRYIKDKLKNLMGRWATHGVDISFQRLVTALEKSGYDVHVNDRSKAISNPEYPVGLAGWPHVLKYWDLPNPTILGPGLFDHPGQAPDLFKDQRYRKYLLSCDWMVDLFRPYYGDCCFFWYAAIDTEMWPDIHHFNKPIDILVYDKIRWDRDKILKAVLEPVVAALTKRKLHFHILRYGSYDSKTFHDLLKQSRAFLFLCEHETQGHAVLEAMASNLPVLAWDPGFFVDPIRLNYSTDNVWASSVPFFSDMCGEKFRNMSEYEEKLGKFLQRQSTYRPRSYVKKNLSFEGSAEIYAREYFSIVP